MKILVTGFEPFGGETINPSVEVIKRLPSSMLTAEIIPLEIPTAAVKSAAKIKEAVFALQPDAVLSIGQAGGRADISVERIGINIDDYRIPDNENNQPIDVPVIAGAPAAYFVTLPIKAMVQNIQAHGIPASISNTAGTFVCNHVCYSIAHFAAGYSPKRIRTGFIHIPFLPEQVIGKTAMPSMALETAVQGITAAIEAIIKYPVDDIKTIGGAVC